MKDETRRSFALRTAASHISSECLNWPFANVQGYGVIGNKVSGKSSNIRVSRLIFEAFNHPLQDGMHACHKCDNPRCYNPRHLFAGTPLQNMQDKARKGRLLYGEKHQNSTLTNQIVAEIRRLRKDGLACSEIARRVGVRSYKHVWKVVTGKLWIGPKATSEKYTEIEVVA